jgi:hypothetical protein
MGLFDAFGRMDRPRNPSGLMGMLGLDRFFEPGGQQGMDFSGQGRQGIAVRIEGRLLRHPADDGRRQPDGVDESRCRPAADQHG